MPVRSVALFLRLVFIVVVLCLALICPAQLASTGWPKVGGGVFNNSQSPGSNTTSNILWSKLGLGSLPVIGNGRVYSYSQGTINASDLLTGALDWTYSVQLPVNLTGQIVASSDGTVYVSSYNAVTYTIVALDGATGAVKWTNNSGPLYVQTIGPDGTLYATYDTTTGSGGLCALNPANGAIRWVDASTTIDYPTGTLVVAPDGNIYGLSYTSLWAIRASDGHPIWELKSSLINQSLLTMGANNTLYYCASNEDVGGSTTDLVAVTAAGAVAWTQPIPPDTLSSPVIDSNGQVYLAEGDGVVRARNGSTGELVWSYTLPNSMSYASPVVDANNVVYVYGGPQFPGGNGFFTALQGATGQVIWSISSPTFLPGMTPAIGTDGTAYVPTSGPLVALKSAHAISLSISPAAVTGLTAASGTVTLFTAAPPGGAIINLTSSNPTAAPSLSVTVPAGQSTATFPIPTNSVVSQMTTTFTATPGTNITATLTVNPPVLQSLTLNPTSVIGGTSSTATVTVNAPCPQSGFPIALGSSDPSASVPATVSIPSGQESITFTVTTVPVDSATAPSISAAANGVTVKGTLNVTPPSVSSLSMNPTAVQGGSTSTGTITLHGPAGPSGCSIALKCPTSAITVPSTVQIGSGQTGFTFTATTSPVNTQTVGTITASFNGSSASATLTVNPATLVSVTLNPTSLQGGASSTGAVNLSGGAGPGGTSVSLSSNVAAASPGSSVLVPSGQNSATFTITTTPVSVQTVATIKATLNGTPQTASLTITPATLTTLSVNPNAVQGGNGATGTVTLSGAAGPGGSSVALNSSTTSVTVPSAVLVPAGQSSATFNITTSPVNSVTTATVKGALNGINQTANLTVNPATLTNFAVMPVTVLGGASSKGTVRLSGPAGPGGAVVSLQSDSTPASVPTSVTVAAGQNTASFTVTTTGTNALINATITATLNGKALTSPLTINPVTILSMTINPTSVAGAAVAVGTITLDGPAAPSGTVIKLSSSNSNATVPSSVTVAGGKTSTTFNISAAPVTTTTNSSISATLGAGTTIASLTMVPLGLQSLTFNPAAVLGNSPSTGTVSLNGLAPSGGYIIKLASSISTVKVPASVTIFAGTQSASFTATTIGVNAQKIATVTGKLALQLVTGTLTVNPPSLTSVSLSPTSVNGGTSSIGTVTLSSPAPSGGMSVQLASSSTSATLPATVSVPSAKSAATFTVKTIAVKSDTSAVIKATLNGVSEQATLTIHAAVLSTLTVSPASLAAGKNATGTVTLTSAAPTGGLTVALSSSLTGATLPVTVVIAAGKTSATFTIKTVKGAKGSATIAGTLNGVTKSATLTVS